MSGATNLPVYFYNPDYAQQEMYQELFNRLLRDWFNQDGFLLPSLTNAQETAIGPTYPPCRIWYNSDLDKLRFVAAGGIETITSV